MCNRKQRRKYLEADSTGREDLCSGCSSRYWTWWKARRERGSHRLRPQPDATSGVYNDQADRPWTASVQKKKYFTRPAEMRSIRPPPSSVPLAPARSEIGSEMPKSRAPRPARETEIEARSEMRMTAPRGHTHLHIHCHINPVLFHLLGQLAYLFDERLGPAQGDESPWVTDKCFTRRPIRRKVRSGQHCLICFAGKNLLRVPSRRTQHVRRRVRVVRVPVHSFVRCARSLRVSKGTRATQARSSPKSTQGYSQISFGALGKGNLKTSLTENSIIPPGAPKTDSSFK